MINDITCDSNAKSFFTYSSNSMTQSKNMRINVIPKNAHIRSMHSNGLLTPLGKYLWFMANKPVIISTKTLDK